MSAINIVHKGVSTPPPPPYFKIIPLITRSPHFLKFPIPHLTGKSALPSFLINRNKTVKLISINVIHVKQEHNVCFFIFKFSLK